MINMKINVGVTGSIGSGKSAFCNFISGMNYPILNADEISKEILKNDRDVKQKIISKFGGESYLGNEINKKFLAEKIFSDPAKVLIINSILHPRVKSKVDFLSKNYFKEYDFVFTEAALIYEADMESMFDYVVLISADYEFRKQRVVKSGKLSEQDFDKRNENQIKDEEKKKRADFIFENNGLQNELKQKAELLISILKGLSLS